MDNKGNVLGLQISDKTLRKISQQIHSRIKPEIVLEIREVKSKSIIKVKIPEGKNKPYFLNGVAYKRVGTENRKIPPDELKSIILQQKQIRWDEEICEGATLEDIEWKFVKDVFIPLYERTSENTLIGNLNELLESLNVIKNNKPTNAGIFLFGKNPQKFFMNSYIAVARYKGKEEGIERLDYKEFKGNLIQEIDSCDKYIKEHITIMSKLLPHQIQRQDIPEYGLFSIRELITNAVCHRDYANQHTKVIIKMFSDRMEFYNPGGLPKDITPENITKKQFSRNPIVANVLAKIKYIEELGEGWNKIVKEYKEHHLKPRMPKIESDESSMLVTVFSTKEKFEKEKKNVLLKERQQKAFEFLKKYGRITNKDYKKLNPQISDKTAFRDLEDLVEKGLLKSIGEKKGRYYEISSK